jgi:hypothetical protein
MSSPRTRRVNWVPFPTPITEPEVKLEIQWSADKRTTEALERQKKFFGCDSVKEYIL